ncbi:hypothetical protein AYO20_09675 [Fonsecaea nubica]|uniref:Uncharacterized protein n=1 Tax=Fonsecaea nubica TaxID=856822 RepID=A0A178CFM2_9EURO|nr:hypothetical protein AYO20_09675 [Fonsecaea nubica]OAL27822.1 hypothetical protein AYO20_09675 [Fonsecaea nubica]
MASFEGKVVAITGAASGIGLASAKILASRGAVLSLCDVQQEKLDEAAQICRDAGAREVVTFIVDVRYSEQVDDWINSTVQKYGKVDCAANIAGLGGPLQTLTETSDKDWEFVMGVNATGCFNCLRAQLRVMESGSSIVNCASISGFKGTSNSSAYTAAKHAVVGLTRVAAREYGLKNIRVNAITPGLVETPLTTGLEQKMGITFPFSQTALNRKSQPTEQANTIVFLLSEDSSYTTGSIVVVDGGWTC